MCLQRSCTGTILRTDLVTRLTQHTLSIKISEQHAVKYTVLSAKENKTCKIFTFRFHLEYLKKKKKLTIEFYWTHILEKQ